MIHTEVEKESHTFIKKDKLILAAILIIAFVFRLYKINTPLADFHSFRQVDTAAVGRNFVKNGFDLMHPKYDDLSNVASGKENPEGHRFVEFPIYNAIFAGIYKTFHLPFAPFNKFTLETAARLTTSIFSLFIIAVIYYLALKERDRLTAVIAGLTYAVFPIFVFYSRMVLPETPSIAMAFVSIFFFYLFTMREKSSKSYLWFALGVVSFAIALLIKPTAGFYGLALPVLFFRKYRFNMFARWEPYVFGFLALLPFVAWRLYIQDYPEGIPANSWLISKVQTWEGERDIFFKPAFFRWIFFERLGLMMFGVYLSFFFVLGTIVKTKKFLLHAILASALIYLLVFQGGNVQHEYYQTVILPALALFVGVGTAWILQNAQLFMHPIIVYPAVITCFLFSFMFSFYKVKDFYGYPQDLVTIANIVKTLTKPEDKIITERLGDTTLLYLSDRKGAANIYKELPEMKASGYKYLVTQDKTQIEKLKSEGYKVRFENDQFALIKL